MIGAAGNALEWVPWAVAIAVGIAVFRDKRRNAWRDQAEAMVANYERLMDEVNALKAELVIRDDVIGVLQAKVAELEARPDYRDLLTALVDHDERTTAVLERICTGLPCMSITPKGGK